MFAAAVKVMEVISYDSGGGACCSYRGGGDDGG